MPQALQASECVVLLHGLARSSASMERMAAALSSHGYAVVNADYPSRHHAIEKLAPLAVEAGLSACGNAETVHFVTHSLGGILVRYYLQDHQISSLGQVVMLAPPNQGSAVVDTYRNVPGFKQLNGPAGLQLGTDAESIPTELGPVDFELGVIAGTRSINPILSLSLDNPDDGKVSTHSARVEGMRDYIELPSSHPFIMRSPEAIRQTLFFIEKGSFCHP